MHRAVDMGMRHSMFKEVPWRSVLPPIGGH